MPQKSFIPPNIWETPSESTKLMIIEHNKKVKLNNPTPYSSGSKTKPNPTLGKPTPAPQQVHQHSQDEPTEEPPPDTSTQTLVKKCLSESGIDPTDIQNVMPVSFAKRNISLGKNIGQQYCWCSLMWLMPLRSLSNCDYELNFYLRLILGPIHSNQVMGTDPVGSYHGTRNSRSNSVNPTYWYQSHD